MNKKILVVGSLNIDMVIDVKQIPEKGETVLGDKSDYIPGGKGANQAYAVANAGGQVMLLGCVGEDKFGENLIYNLHQAGVDISQIERSKEVSTGMAIVAVNKEGDNSIIVVPGANTQCNIGYLKKRENYIRNSDYIILQMEIPEETIYEVISMAKHYGKTVILNPAPAPGYISDDILKLIDYITPNEKEIMTITGKQGETVEEIQNAAEFLVARGVKNVIVTLGKRGAMLVTSKKCRIFPVREVVAVDTTAAGDCFNGAFVTGLAEGKEVDEAIQFANLFSSIAVTRNGAQKSIPKRAEVENIYI